MQRLWIGLVISAFQLFSVSALVFAIPNRINYQGSLAAADGSPLDTSVAVTFTIYDAASGGSGLWSETHPAVSVANGLFAVQLGSVAALPDLFAANRWLGITIGADTEMSPRQQIISVAHAYRVGTVDGASGGTIAGNTVISGKLNAGSGNSNNGTFAMVMGQSNQASGSGSVVAGGTQNTASGGQSAVSGGTGNQSLGISSNVGGGSSNTAGAVGAVVSGGTFNTASGDFSAVSGGNNNTASGFAVVSGGNSNSAAGTFGAIGGGQSNHALASGAAVGGGGNNRARGMYSVIAGGGGGSIVDSNSAMADWSTVGGGRAQSASGRFSTASGGESNIADGWWSTVPGGSANLAEGNYSFAAGRQATTFNDGAFVWGSSSTGAFTNAYGDYTATFRCENGARFYTHPSATNIGVNLPAGGGAWANLCDVNQKNLLGGVNTSDILRKVSTLPLHKWSYKSQDESIQHIGPTAQDFHAAFGLGDDNTTISTLDPDGVALAAIQELAKENEELRTAVRRYETTNINLEERIARLETQLQSLIAGEQQSFKEER